MTINPSLSEGLYFQLRDDSLVDNVVLPGSTVLIDDIGSQGGTNPDQPGRALLCVTTNVRTSCCRISDGGKVGEWYYPDGTIVTRGNPATASSPFTRTGSTQQVRLNRANTAASAPTGAYECRVPDNSEMEQVAVIHLGIAMVVN